MPAIVPPRGGLDIDLHPSVLRLVPIEEPLQLRRRRDLRLLACFPRRYLRLVVLVGFHEADDVRAHSHGLSPSCGHRHGAPLSCRHRNVVSRRARDAPRAGAVDSVRKRDCSTAKAHPIASRVWQLLRAGARSIIMCTAALTFASVGVAVPQSIRRHFTAGIDTTSRNSDAARPSTRPPTRDAAFRAALRSTVLPPFRKR